MSARTWRRIALLVFAMAVLMALRLIGPAVPKEIRWLTGPKGTTFFENGLRYRAFLEHHGIEVALEPTDGSIETLKRLAEAQSPSAGFVSGLWNASGHTTEAPEGLESIGTMYPQPLWVFARKGTEPGGLAGLGGQQVEAGESGSDGRLLALLLLSEAGIAGEVDFAPGNRTTPDRIEAAVRNDEVSAIIAAGEPDSVVIDRLLRTPELEVIEREASKEADPKRLLDELAKLERATATIRVPLRSLEVQWLELRQYLHDLRDWLESA